MITVIQNKRVIENIAENRAGHGRLSLFKLHTADYNYKGPRCRE